MIYAYPKYPSIVQGNQLVLCVKTSSPYFRVDIFTPGALMPISDDVGKDPFQGQHIVPKSSFGWTQNKEWNPMNGFMAPLAFERAEFDWNWSEYSFDIPADWSSGLYVAILWEGDDTAPIPNVVDGGEYDRDYGNYDENNNFISRPLDQVISRQEVFEDISALNLAGHSGRALFVIKSAQPGQNASILYKLNLFTHHAYNSTGNPPTSVYELYFFDENGNLTRDLTYDTGVGKPTPVSVSLRRPGGGTGGFSTVGQDQYMSADSALIYWLQNQPYKVDYCTDLDIDNDDGSFLGAYRLLICGTHDEYWSLKEKNNVEQFVQNGNNVMFLGANVAWKQVEITPCRNAFNPFDTYCMTTVFKYDALFWEQHGNQFQYLGEVDSRGGQPPQPLWWINSIFDEAQSSENSLTGQSYRNAGGRWDSPSQKNWESNPLGYYVQIDPTNSPYGWIFQGTDLKQYDVFGDTSFVVDNECDGVFINAYDDNNPFPPKVTAVTEDTDTHFSNLPPQGYVLLAASVELRTYGGEWNQFPPRTWGKYPGDNLYYFATMGIFQKGGTVFSCGTTQWGRALLRNDHAVSQITTNLITRLAGLNLYSAVAFQANTGNLWTLDPRP